MAAIATDSIILVSPVAAVQAFTATMNLVQSPPCEKPTWWDVQVYGYGNEINVGIGAIGPAPTDSELKSAQRSVPLRARVKWEGTQVDFDIGGGMRIAVYAQNIALDVIAPAGSIQIRSPNDGGLTGGGAAPIQQQNSMVFGSIAAVDAPIGDRVAKLTDVVDTTAAINVNIPASAKKVQVFQAGVVAPAPIFFQSNALSAVNLGQIDFRAIVQPNSTDILSIPGRATQIACPAQARVLTFVWQLEM